MEISRSIRVEKFKGMERICAKISNVSNVQKNLTGWIERSNRKWIRQSTTRLNRFCKINGGGSMSKQTKYRIFELSKEFKKDSKVIIELLKKHKIKVANHFSAIDETAYQILKEAFARRPRRKLSRKNRSIKNQSKKHRSRKNLNQLSKKKLRLQKKSRRKLSNQNRLNLNLKDVQKDQ